MVVVKILGTLVLTVILFYAIIGALFMHGTRYDYEQSIERCREIVNIYPDNATITAEAGEK